MSILLRRLYTIRPGCTTGKALLPRVRVLPGAIGSRAGTEAAGSPPGPLRRPGRLYRHVRIQLGNDLWALLPWTQPVRAAVQEAGLQARERMQRESAERMERYYNNVAQYKMHKKRKSRGPIFLVFSTVSGSRFGHGYGQI